ncbi:hypothetical protein H0H87_007825 [Tephrocybe sp. NHM501043]|nr:hypothetical protein H0H87_007825 [Tephrocybe sp. NHM501043]
MNNPGWKGVGRDLQCSKLQPTSQFKKLSSWIYANPQRLSLTPNFIIFATDSCSLGPKKEFYVVDAVPVEDSRGLDFNNLRIHLNEPKMAPDWQLPNNRAATRTVYGMHMDGLWVKTVP